MTKLVPWRPEKEAWEGGRGEALVVLNIVLQVVLYIVLHTVLYTIVHTVHDILNTGNVLHTTLYSTLSSTLYSVHCTVCTVQKKPRSCLGLIYFRPSKKVRSTGHCRHMLYTVVQYSAEWCSLVKYSALQCSAVQCSAVQCSAVQCSAEW